MELIQATSPPDHRRPPCTPHEDAQSSRRKGAGSVVRGLQFAGELGVWRGSTGEELVPGRGRDACLGVGGALVFIAVAKFTNVPPLPHPEHILLKRRAPGSTVVDAQQAARTAAKDGLGNPLPHD